MPRSKKPLSNSRENLYRIFAGANMEIAPPAHVPLTDNDWPYWHSVIDEFAKADWTRHQLELAAFLARTMTMVEAEQRALSTEGTMTTGPNGQPLPNPRTRVVKLLTGQVLAIRRSLGISVRAKSGSSGHAAKTRDANLAIERRVKDQGDDLLA